MKYSGLMPPSNQAGGCCFVSTPPRPALLSAVHSALWTAVLKGVNLGVHPLRTHLLPSKVFFSSIPPTLPASSRICCGAVHFLPPRCWVCSTSAAWLFPAGKGAGYSSTWTLSIHDQWRGPALYTKLSRRAGLFYSQPCEFKQIAQTGELKQILSYRSKT